MFSPDLGKIYTPAGAGNGQSMQVKSKRKVQQSWETSAFGAGKGGSVKQLVKLLQFPSSFKTCFAQVSLL